MAGVPRSPRATRPFTRALLLATLALVATSCATVRHNAGVDRPTAAPDSPAASSEPAGAGAASSSAPVIASPTIAPSTASPPASPSASGGTPKQTPPPAPSKQPTAPALPPTAPGTLNGKVVVLDPGHNLNNSSSINQLVNAGNGVIKACDTVGTATPGSYPEHAFTWDVANRAAAILRSEGATVILTRSSDSGIGPCVTTRAQIGNDAHADAFIAIHADGGPSGGHGFFVMQPPPNNPNVNPGGATRSRVLATVMHDTFHTATGVPYSSYIANGYYPDSTTTGTINLSHGPVITIECLDMRNAGDAALAADPAGRQRVAAGIAAGVTAFLTR